MIKKLWLKSQSAFLTYISSVIHLKFIQKLYKIKREDAMIDIGCGEGELLKHLEGISDHCIGLDINIDFAKKVNIEKWFVCGDAECLPFKDLSFNIVISSNAIEHLYNFENALMEFTRVLKSHGKLILIYPSEPILGIMSYSNILSSKNKYMIHKQLFSPNKIKSIIKKLNNVGLRYCHSRFYFALSPMYITLLCKERS